MRRGGKVITLQAEFVPAEDCSSKTYVDALVLETPGWGLSFAITHTTNLSVVQLPRITCVRVRLKHFIFPDLHPLGIRSNTRTFAALTLGLIVVPFKATAAREKLRRIIVTGPSPFWRSCVCVGVRVCVRALQYAGAGAAVFLPVRKIRALFAIAPPVLCVLLYFFVSFSNFSVQVPGGW